MLLLCNRIITSGIFKSILSSVVLPAVSYKTFFVSTESAESNDELHKLNYIPGWEKDGATFHRKSITVWLPTM